MFKNIVFLQCFVASGGYDFRLTGTGGVGCACRADRLNRHFVGVGDISWLTFPQHRPKIANICPT